MEKIFTILAAIILTASVFAQAPEKMSYQAVIRDNNGNLVTNNVVGVRLSLLQGSVSGNEVYKELFNPNPETNANGLLTLEIGAGVMLTGSFSSIDWANGPYFIKIETDPTGGTNYTIIGTSQLLSVPYALHAKTAETFTGTFIETDPSVPSGTQPGEMQYWNGSEWVTVAPGATGQVLTLDDGVPIWTTPGIYDIENPSTGKIWMDRNLGASRNALSSTDAAAYGDLYQWGRATDSHEMRTSRTTTNLSGSNTPGHGNFITIDVSPFDWRSPQNDNLWQGVNGTNNPCPHDYRLPTEAEWDAERTSWSSNNAAGAFASPLKLPLAGYRIYSSGSLSGVGSYGLYWSSTVGSIYSRYLHFDNGLATMDIFRRAYGFSVRCLKD